jgi:hypothetical protein
MTNEHVRGACIRGYGDLRPRHILDRQAFSWN